MEYLQPVTRARHVVLEYWFELLIVALAVSGMLELIILRDSPGAPTTSLKFSVPAMAVLVLPLLAYRRYPFAAPASYWLLAIAITLVNGTLIPFVDSLSVVGLAAAFLLGNLQNGRHAWIGLAIVVGAPGESRRMINSSIPAIANDTISSSNQYSRTRCRIRLTR